MLELIILNIFLIFINVLILKLDKDIIKNILWVMVPASVVGTLFFTEAIVLTTLQSLLLIVIFLIGFRYSKLKSVLLFSMQMLFVLPQLNDAQLFYGMIGITSLIFTRNVQSGFEMSLFSLYSFGMMLFAIIFPVIMVQYEYLVFLLVTSILCALLVFKRNKEGGLIPLAILSVASSFYYREIVAEKELTYVSWLVGLLIIFSLVEKLSTRKFSFKELSLVVIGIVLNSPSNLTIMSLNSLAIVYLLCRFSISDIENKYAKYIFSFVLLMGLIKTSIIMPLLVVSCYIVFNFLSEEKECRV